MSKKRENPNFVYLKDYYIENGKYILTAAYLEKRGYCCKNGCRHCPYGFKKDEKTLPD